ncbi:type I-E CRISPR-associated protein Cas6/Cse3/CasE [Kitasatospora sp. NPDC006697]|uniref:type I-E CRISPR-associated protein Cas6/Cse3/CasE n=1 Tax=Kitasatospora sp. NPDC006697 TaxID=3364020 RepID=UPI00367EC059
MSLWLSRILPDQRHGGARKDLAAAVDMHHRLMSLFPDHIGDEARAALKILFRVEDSATGPQILLQSAQPPDADRLPAGYGSMVTKPLGPLLDALQPDLPVRFRIAASPIRKPGRTTRELYKLSAVVPLSGAAADEWWTRQAEASGLKITTLHSVPLDAATGTRRQDSNRIKHNRTQFDGTAVITDPALLRTRITDGIGKGKAYGCGLLSIAPAGRRP